MEHKTLEELRLLAYYAVEEVKAAKEAFHAAANKLREKTENAVILEKFILEQEVATLFDDAAPWRLKEFVPSDFGREAVPLVPSPELSAIEGLEEVDVDIILPSPLSPAEQDLIDAGQPLNRAFILEDAQEHD